MKAKTLLTNARIHTMSGDLVVDSMALHKGRIVAVGNRLQYDQDFRSYQKIDMKKRPVIPGLVDAHTHLFFMAAGLDRLDVDGVTSMSTCLKRLKAFAAKRPRHDWIVGLGFSPDRLTRRVEPTRELLDQVVKNRPVVIYYKDWHSAWVNSRALEIAGITSETPDPEGGRIERDYDGSPVGILREPAAYTMVSRRIPYPADPQMRRLYNQALEIAWSRGVTGVHSFDGPEGFAFFEERHEKGKLGLRINYYPVDRFLDALEKNQTTYGAGDDWLRIAGVKIFADGALGSQTALCFNKYRGSENNYGIEVNSVADMKRSMRRAARLGFPCAVHAIGDKATDNVLTAMETVKPPITGARHRIEHVQLIRRKDIRRLRDRGIIASVQPSHCPSDIEMMNEYWGERGRNAFPLRTFEKQGIDLAFGSDTPIEPLHPIDGIAAAVRRARPGSRKPFYPEERVTAATALRAFTVGAAIAAGQAHCRGYLLPEYPADFAVLDTEITRCAPARIYDTRVMATVIDGKVRYSRRGLL